MAEKKNKYNKEELFSRIQALLDSSDAAGAMLDAFIGILEEKWKLDAKIEDNSSSAEKNGGKISDKTAYKWLPVLGRTSAGIVNYWSDDNPEPVGLTQLHDLIKKHLNFLNGQNDNIQIQYQWLEYDMQASAVESGVDEEINEKVQFIQLSQPDNINNCQYIKSPIIGQQYRDAFVLRVDGDSMSDMVCDGDFVVVSPSCMVRNGAVAIIKLHEQIGITCKIYREDGDKVHLVPANRKYDIQIYNKSQVHWAMPVLWRIRLN